MIAIQPLMLTSKGYEVSGCQRSYTPATNDYDRISGRVRVDKNDPSKDEVVSWDLSGSPMGHECGSLVAKTGSRNESVSGFNIFRGLYEQVQK